MIDPTTTSDINDVNGNEIKGGKARQAKQGPRRT